MDRAERVGLGGKVYQVAGKRRLICLVEDLLVEVLARVVETIGKDEDRREVNYEGWD